ncbi:MAG: radical SAM family heme chaperone HemW [Cyclobacteriaceae bacterium]
MSGIYIHIPYCRQACHYCDFHFSTSLQNKTVMIAALIREIELQASIYNKTLGKIKTLYFGGGTPSLLDKNELGELISKVESCFDLNDCEEITLEANPEDIDENELNSWFELGVNRLSVGVQSFENKLLKSTNRSHDAIQAKKAIRLINESQIENFTIDLMFGIPGYSTDQWEKDLRIALEFNVPHLSVYGLTIEPKTVFGNWHSKGIMEETTEDEMMWLFRHTHQMLVSSGYEHYEVSNYALPNMQSKHNTAYWQGKSYIGIGPGAHSFDGLERRYNISNNNKYIESLGSDKLAHTIEYLTSTDRINETIFTSLRTIAGLDLGKLKEQFGKDLLHDHAKKIKSWEEMGLLEVREGYLRLTIDGMLLTDEISLKLLYS